MTNRGCLYFFLRGNLGNIFLNLTKIVEILSPATTRVTAVMISVSPHTSRILNVSPNTVMPKNIAVTGSNTPSMAVGVEPIYCMASVVQTNETVVVNTDRANMFPHIYQCDGNRRFCPMPSLQKNSTAAMHIT